MWASRSAWLSNNRIVRVAIDYDGTPATYADVIDGWQNNSTFRSFFNRLLLEPPFSVYRWETPPVTTATEQQPFEFVLLDSPELDGAPDSTPFNEHFISVDPGQVITFPNLGNDAIMVVPTPDHSGSDYAHLAAFLRESQEPQQLMLWQQVGAAMRDRVGDRPVWLSTAGGGVSWLHVRLDDRPKYYGFAPYRTAN